jgi:MoaA/NifB/PqqE/SkfB family radical SAM enzyme
VEAPVTASSYMFPPVRVNGCRYGEALARLSPEEAAAAQLRCREQFYPLEQLYAIANGINIDEEFCCGEESENMRCRAGKSAFWVTWDGRMLPCGMFPMEGFSLKEYGFRRAWEEVRQLTRTVMTPKECSACPKKNRCAVCAAACFAETGFSDVRPDYICRMTQEYDRLLCNKYKKTENSL